MDMVRYHVALSAKEVRYPLFGQPVYSRIAARYPTDKWQHYTVYAQIREGGMRYAVGFLAHHRQTRRNVFFAPMLRNDEVLQRELPPGEIQSALDSLAEDLSNAWIPLERRFDLSGLFPE